VLRAEGGKEVATATVDDDGRVQFKTGWRSAAGTSSAGMIAASTARSGSAGTRRADDTVTFQPPVGGVAVKTAGGVEIDSGGA
jgi:hypothetical protein